jgi:ABC-2 type transport system permease protein
LLRVVYLLPLMFILLRNVGDNGAMRLPMGVGAVAFMCGQVAGSLVWLTVAAEDAPELIGCAPASAAAIRRAKLCAALAPLAALMVVPLIVLTTLSTIAGLAATAGCAAAALVSALIGFALQKPAKRSAFRRREAGSLVASLAEFGAGAIIALTAGFAVVWPPLIAAPISVAALAAWALWRSDGVPRRALPNTQVVLH